MSIEVAGASIKNVGGGKVFDNNFKHGDNSLFYNSGCGIRVLAVMNSISGSADAYQLEGHVNLAHQEC